MEARNRFEVYRELKRNGAKLLSLKKQSSGIFSLDFWNERLSTVPETEIILFADNMSTMISAGLSLSRAISTAQKQSKNPKMKSVLGKLLQDVEGGVQFFEALSKNKNVFSDLFVSMVKAGELSGNLPSALKSVAIQMGRVHTLKRKIKGAMIYPSIIILAVFAVGIFMMTSVVPTLAKTFEEMNVELPYSTRLIILISDILKNYYIFAIAISLLLIFSIYSFLKTECGKRLFSKFILKIPIIKGISKELNSAYAARTLASLLKSGVDIVDSVNIASDVVQNRLFRNSLQDISESLKKGKTLTELLRNYEGLFPVMFVELVAVGEETGSVTDMMQKVADYYEEEVNEKTKNMSTIIEPFLMLFIGVAVGYFAVAMITPMYSLSSSI